MAKSFNYLIINNMKLPHLSNREQLLIALSICVIFVGAYTWLRFLPANRTIGGLQQAAEATEQRTRTTTIPEQPDEDVGLLDDQLLEQEQLVAALKSQSDSAERRLAPADSQLLIVDISRVARNAQVNVRANEDYKALPTASAGASPAPTGKKARKKQAAQSAATIAVAESAELTIPQLSEGWITRMSPGSAYARPLRRLELEGSYMALNRFIHDLEALPFHVAVLRMSIEKMPTLSMPGYPQALMAEFVLAL
jgi:hypothetical protein